VDRLNFSDVLTLAHYDPVTNNLIPKSAIDKWNKILDIVFSDVDTRMQLPPKDVFRLITMYSLLIPLSIGLC